MSGRKQKPFKITVTHIGVYLSLILFLLPFLWMILASFKTQVQILNTENIFSITANLDNYISVFEEYAFLKFIINSFIVGILSTFFGLVLGLPAAYAIAKYKQEGLGLLILVARIVPGISFLIPWFIIFSRMQLIDTYTALILSHMLVTMPFIVWVMIPFFEGLPSALEESARIDGCTIPSAFIRIILPISGPGIITSTILAFIFSWNNFMFSIILAGEKTKTLPIAVFNFLSYSEINWGGLMAASVIITAPVLILALFAQRYIIAGLTGGSVKG
ncbi:carbohydrate ABC transporter permease [Alkalihalobacillus sp. AL-G]|uniref:carbohydrate ABC transporter permease n=1 Tax=Alkalihalobacillus sp. AL-G TaxID=2926399 RepID=UPI00272A423F|nr:carbohydrate ABC transporter permease [Alkalihalobacillus sp. AL-G]WLD94115.1 carbohydrate ABC transporter permease [Alkalihalobacillus sp. AL-G]